ncbi:MAG TPA: transglutaminase [Gammaproteobacteria bacterium]|nr:transglutaminase [Gammaproteobacteria bacterium]
MKEQTLDLYLKSTNYIDSDNPDIIEYARHVVGSVTNQVTQAIRLYYAVRDDIRYNPYAFSGGDDTFKASYVLANKEGYCVPKAILLAAVGRAMGIPTRLGFADVRNHLTSPKLKQLMQTDIFAFHGNTGFFLNNKWVKCTPAFNLSLCEKANVKPLEFDGTCDSLFHPLDNAGNKHMEYLKDRGDFADFPREEMARAYAEVYGGKLGSISDININELSNRDFESEVTSN